MINNKRGSWVLNFWFFRIAVCRQADRNLLIGNLILPIRLFQKMLENKTAQG